MHRFLGGNDSSLGEELELVGKKIHTKKIIKKRSTTTLSFSSSSSPFVPLPSPPNPNVAWGERVPVPGMSPPYFFAPFAVDEGPVDL